MATVNLVSNLEQVAHQFHQARAQTQLVVLHDIIQKIHRISKMATPSAFFSQKVQEVLKSLHQVPKGDRQQALEEILHGSPTRLTEAYDQLDTNMRMAFWYRLVNGRHENSWRLATHADANSRELAALLSEIDALDSNELVSLLRLVVAASESVAY
jgi:hypothetical protein